jgi:hypothetical protein
MQSVFRKTHAHGDRGDLKRVRCRYPSSQCTFHDLWTARILRIVCEMGGGRAVIDGV